ncbi:MAG: tetratricopeptide repeat protein, partial [Rickettsiales bacterium]|nr:tetratricopeptide repeat protein [Rickettsiales bacterium]
MGSSSSPHQKMDAAMLHQMDTMLGQAYGMLQQGKVAEAGQIAQHVLNSVPGHAKALFLMACTAEKYGDYINAAARCREAIESDPKQTTYYFKLADFLNKQFKYEEALEVIEKAVNIAPTNANLLMMLGETAFRAMEIEKATDAFERVIRLKPDFHEAKRSLIVAYESTNKLDKARSILNDVKQTDPDNLYLRVSEGRLDRREKNYKSAIVNLEFALKTIQATQPQNVEMRGNILEELAKSYEGDGRYEDAYRTMSEAQQLFQQHYSQQGNNLNANRYERLLAA